MLFAVGFSVSCIYFTDLVLSDFTARFNNYAFSTMIPIAASPLVVYPVLWLLRRVEQAQAELEHMARTDALTEVANRRGFFEAAAAAFSGSDSVTMMMVDIDHFKRVNDLFGHAAGDELLRHLAKMIGETVRSDAGIVGRLGGEEFAILISGADEHRMQRLAERLCRRARKSALEYDGHRIGATFSIGMAFASPGDSVDAVLKMADRAAYRAKREGRDRWLLAAADTAEYARKAETRAA